MKYLSIIIPVYNVEQYLAKCLDSLLDCERPGLEIIAVNDGSTDSSPEILADYAAKYPSLKVLAKQNGGLGSARNFAFPEATGKYVFFLDSDDFMPEGALDEMLSICQSREFDICFFDMDSVDDSGNILEHVAGANQPGPFSLESNPDILLCRMNACNKLFKLSLFKSNGILFKDREWYEDVSSVPKLYALANTMIYEPKVWYKYLLRSGSIMNNKNLKRNLEIINAVEATYDFYREKGLFKKYHDQLEYISYYNVLIAASVRIILADAKSPYSDELLNYFLKTFPDYKLNPYVKSAPMKYKLLAYLLKHKMRGAVKLIMSLNAAIK